MLEIKWFRIIAALMGLLAFPAVAGAQGVAKSGRQASAVELYARFRDAKAGSRGSAFLDKIRSDGKGVYFSDPAGGHPNYVLLSKGSGRLILQIQPSRLVARQVVFEFDRPTRTVDYEHLACHSYHPAGPQDVGFAPPTDLADHENPNGSDKVFTRISTTNEFRGEQVRDANGETQLRWVSTGRVLNLATMTAGPDARAYVGLSVWYWIRGHRGVYYLSLNNNSDAREISGAGIAEVTHPDDRTWVLKPLTLADPDTTSATPTANEFRRRIVVNGDTPHERGWCNLGDWEMPFELTLTRRY